MTSRLSSISERRIQETRKNPDFPLPTGGQKKKGQDARRIALGFGPTGSGPAGTIRISGIRR